MISLLLMAAACAAAEPGLESLGRELGTAAGRAGIARVAVQPFEIPPGAAAEFGREAAETVVQGLLDSGRVRVVERERLSPILSENGLSVAGAVESGRPLPQLKRADAVVLGRLYKTSKNWVAAARLVSVATGEVLAGSSVSFIEEGVGRVTPAVLRRTYPPLADMIDAAHALAETSDAEELKRLVHSADLPALRRAAAILALSESDPGDDLSFGEALHDREPLVRFAGALAVGRSRSSWAEGPLRAMLRDDTSWLPRFGSAQVLGRFTSSGSARDLSTAAASDPAWQVREQAAHSLVALGRKP